MERLLITACLPDFKEAEAGMFAQEKLCESMQAWNFLRKCYETFSGDSFQSSINQPMLNLCNVLFPDWKNAAFFQRTVPNATNAKQLKEFDLIM